VDDGRPPTADEIDTLAKIRKDSTRVLAFSALFTTLVLLLVIAGGAVVLRFQFDTIGTQQQQLRSQQRQLAADDRELQEANQSTCAFYYLIGTLPLIVSGPEKSSAIGVKLIIDSRIAYSARGCQPTLVPPSPALVDLAREYHIKLPV
jgi:outer membrane murein-binding lipoprotein Lpp